MLDAILEYATTGKIPSVFIDAENRLKDSKNIAQPYSELLPKRIESSHLHKYSKVLSASGPNTYQKLPVCPIFLPVIPKPLNKTLPM